MSKQKITDSPLKRFQLGATTEPEEEDTEHKNIKTQKHTDMPTKSVTTKEPIPMKRTTVYMPEELALRLKIYAARHKEDMSGIIIKLVEKLLTEE